MEEKSEIIYKDGNESSLGCDISNMSNGCLFVDFGSFYVM